MCAYNMVNFARTTIPNYRNLTSYPDDAAYNPDTSYTNNFMYAFENMRNIKDPISSVMGRFNWSSCTNMHGTFMNCQNLTGSLPPLPSKVESFRFAFQHCYNISGSIPVIPNKTTNMAYMFNGCNKLTGPLPTIPNSVTIMAYTFRGCSGLTGGFFDIPENVTNADAVFWDCKGLQGPMPKVHNNLSNAYGIFRNCNITGAINMDTYSNPKIGTIAYLFYNCYKLTGSISKFPPNMIYMHSTFYNCSNITGTIPNITSTNFRGAAYPFYNCQKLSSSNIYIFSDILTECDGFTSGCKNTMNIYVHANTTTYNTFYKAMGNSTYNASWGPAYLKTF